MDRNTDHIEDEERRRLQRSFNRRISHLCILVALVICVIALATLVIDVANMQFVMVGIVVSIILLAVALLQELNDRDIHQ